MDSSLSPGAENFMSNSKPETSASGSGAKPTSQGAGMDLKSF